MAKTRSENQAHKTICYNAKLDILQEKIDRLSKADSIGIQIGKNHAKIKNKVRSSDK